VPIAVCRLQCADCSVPIAVCRLQCADCSVPIADGDDVSLFTLKSLCSNFVCKIVTTHRPSLQTIISAKKKNATDHRLQNRN
jgi:hypothetical protein